MVFCVIDFNFPPRVCIRKIFLVITEIYLIMLTINIFQNILSIQYFIQESQST